MRDARATLIHVRDARATVDARATLRVGMALFIASEVMFFAGLIGAYLVLRSAQPVLFAKQAAVLSVWLGSINVAVMIASSFAMGRATTAARRHDSQSVLWFAGITLLLGGAFVAISGHQYASRFSYHTIATKDPTGDRLIVYDGQQLSQSTNQITLRGSRSVLSASQSFNIHTWPPTTLKSPQVYTIARPTVLQNLPDGPSKNNFFGLYFVLSGAHLIHLLGGMIALLFIWLRATRTPVPIRVIEPLGMYWQFLTLVCIVIFGLMYL